MSLALYRKYRPATFAEVIGQEHVTEPLRQALRNNKVHHAYLFSGPRGCGKTSSARILARSLNCAQGPTPDPCGTCPSCLDLAPSGPGSIDVIEIDAASHGGVDDARELRERSFYAPVSSRFKIYIIDEAHMVTTAGFNALLKLVEEPPPHLKFIFATTEPDKVIGTIRSRTHHYPFRLVPPGALRDNLAGICAAEGVAIEPAALGLVVRAGAGSVRDAQSVLDQLVAAAGDAGVTYADAVALLGYTDAHLLDDVVDAFAARDGGAVLEIVDRVIEAGHDPRRFAEDLLVRLRDLIVMDAVPDAETKGLLDAPVDVLERMRRQAGQLGRAELTRAADIVNAGLTEMRGATAPRLLLELICARVLLPVARDGSGGLADLLVRLERLERRLQMVEPEAPRRAPARPVESALAPAPAPAARPAASGSAPVPSRAAPSPARPSSAGPSQAGSFQAGPSRGGSSQGAASPAGPPPASPAPAGPGLTGELDALDAKAVRRRWDEVLDATKRRRRATHAVLVSGPTQVVDVSGGVLTIGFPTGPLQRQFQLGGNNEDVLRDALREVLGVDWRIQTTLAGAGDATHGVRHGVALDLGRGGPEPTGDSADDLTDVSADVSAGDEAESGIALLQRQLGATVIEDSESR